MFRKNILFISVFALVIVLSINVARANSGSSADEQHAQYIKSVNRLAAAQEKYTQVRRESRKLEKYAEVVRSIHDKWHTENKTYFARLMRQACTPLVSGVEFENEQRVNQLARKYLFAALAHADKVRIQTELQLARQLLYVFLSYERTTDKAWSKLRKRTVEAALRARKGMEEVLDRDWYTKKGQPPGHELLPEEYPSGIREGHSGMSPEAIEDPELRAKYKAKLEEKRREQEEFWRQDELRRERWLRDFPEEIEKGIVEAYSQPPHKLDQLHRMLKKYVESSIIQARIMYAVGEKIEEKAENAKKKRQ